MYQNPKVADSLCGASSCDVANYSTEETILFSVFVVATSIQTEIPESQKNKNKGRIIKGIVIP